MDMMMYVCMVFAGYGNLVYKLMSFKIFSSISIQLLPLTT